MKSEIELAIAAAVKDVFGIELSIELTRPDEQFGDYATNVALQLGKRLNKNPRDVGEVLAANLENNLSEVLSDISVVGPGFLNVRLSDRSLVKMLTTKSDRPFLNQTVVAEYSDANPFKVLHAGHVYTTVVGDAIASLLENGGATVHRVNFGGDVGLHVGKTMWAIVRKLDKQQSTGLLKIPVEERATWMAQRYVEGERAYNDSGAAKTEIIEMNKRIYRIQREQDHESDLAKVYWTCRQWSYDAFDAFFALFGTKLEKYYPESEVAELGLQTVQEHLGSVFDESDGAVIFNGAKYGLHTRVFINSEGLPTYEAKDVGLIARKYEDYHFDRSVVITDNEQQQYMQVVLKAIEQFWPNLVRATTHITHGKVKLLGGVKMSSRKGNIVQALELLAVTTDELKRAGRTSDDDIMLGAVKYAFLKVRIGGDIIYDPKESIALEGNSGPYLQYAHARARSILAKSKGQEDGELGVLQPDERSLLYKITEYSEVVQKATNDLMPHYICTYLYELAQKFNQFYEHNRVIGDSREALRLQLVHHYANTLKNGLNLLGIHSPERM